MRIHDGKPSAHLGLLWIVLTLAGGSLPAGRLSAQQSPARTEPAAVNAQTAAATYQTAAATYQTAADPDLPLDQLKLLVRPLTRDELAVEAAAWRELLKDKVREGSELQIRMKQLRAGSKPQPSALETSSSDLAARLASLHEQRTDRSDRLEIVLDEWERKGGEVEEFRQYILAVSGLGIDTADVTTAWTALRAWLVSEQGGQRWLANGLKFLGILLAFYVLAWIVSKLLNQVLDRIRGISSLLRRFLAGFVRQSVVVVGLVVAISALEVNISPLLAAIGGAAFVIGLALQGTLSNFASGLIILGYRPFDVGDVVEAAGIVGIVDSMTLISTRIRTFDNKLMIVPNNSIAASVITNASASETRRVDMVFGISYDDDVDRAREIIERVVAEHPLVLAEPAPVVRLSELADSSVNFICRPWSKSGDYWSVLWDVTRAVKQEFDRNGITIPYPQRDVHVYQHNPVGQGPPDPHHAVGQWNQPRRRSRPGV